MMPAGVSDDIANTVNGWFQKVLETQEGKDFVISQAAIRSSRRLRRREADGRYHRPVEAPVEVAGIEPQ